MIRATEIKVNELIEVSNDVIDWLKEYGDEITRAGHTASARNIRRKLKKVSKALKKKPSIAVFGQSQVGKSYLVQNITKPTKEHYLRIQNKGGEPIDFLTKINPEGGGSESSGVVTRFTLSSKENTDPNYPFSLELFNELDIAAILVNGYLSDIKKHKTGRALSLEDINNLFLSIELNESSISTIDSDDVRDFVDYLKSNFYSSQLISQLDSLTYFGSLIEKLPAVPPSDRWKILEHLWGKNDFFTTLYLRLVSGLETMGFAHDIAVGLDAIAPNDKTIIGIALNRSLFDSDTLISDQISVKLLNGSVVKVSRAVLAALTKEVVLVADNDFSEDPTRAFLNDSDILDFPGSKSRVTAEEATFDLKPIEDKLQVWIRGKVAYLFDHYSENQGLSSLLFCLDSSPPEVADMPDRIEKWVGTYIGKGPEERKERINEIQRILRSKEVNFESVSPLMVVLTKFNVNMSDVLPGNETNRASHDAKWEARFDENFKSIMNRTISDEWITNWISEGSSFNFVFPLRDPKYSKAIFDRDENNIETKVHSSMVSALTSMGESFISSTIVKELVSNPKEIWREISSPNGTGLEALCRALGPAAHPAVMEARLDSAVEKAYKALKELLDVTGSSGDLEDERRKARKKGVKASMVLTAFSMSSNRLALSRVLDALVVHESDIHTLLYNYKFRQAVAEERQSPNIDPATIVEELRQSIGVILSYGDSKEEILSKLSVAWPGIEAEELDELFNDNFGMSLDTLTRALNQAGAEENDRSGFTTAILSYWHRKVIDVLDQEIVFEGVSIKQKEHFVLIVNELVRSIDRYDLYGQISRQISEIVSGPVSDQHFELVSSCVATMLNNFLFTASWGTTPEDERPTIALDAGRRIFANRGGAEKKEFMEEVYRENWFRPFIADWAKGCEDAFIANVNYAHGESNEVDTSKQKGHDKLVIAITSIKD